LDDAIGVRVVERPQQHAVHDAEHRGIRPDAEGQRDQRDGRE
jgi:hypothetical protein